MFINILKKETRFKRKHGGENGLFIKALQLKNAQKLGMMIKILGTVLDDLRKYYLDMHKSLLIKGKQEELKHFVSG